jgi:hypothetical protein
VSNGIVPFLRQRAASVSQTAILIDKIKSNAARKSPPEIKAAPAPKPQSKLSQKPDAAWSDEFKTRMQEDMDALRR